MWSFKTGGLSWQWSLKTGFTVLETQPVLTLRPPHVEVDVLDLSDFFSVCHCTGVELGLFINENGNVGSSDIIW